MKFQNPLIWLTYKFEAYKEEEKPLTTVADLIAHCKVDGICHRRFDAINAHLRERHDGKDLVGPDISSWSFAQKVLYRLQLLLDGRKYTLVEPWLPLEDLAKDRRFIAICFDLSFQTKWSRHENDAAGKWKHYAFEKELPEKYSCGCC